MKNTGILSIFIGLVIILIIGVNYYLKEANSLFQLANDHVAKDNLEYASKIIDRLIDKYNFAPVSSNALDLKAKIAQKLHVREVRRKETENRLFEIMETRAIEMALLKHPICNVERVLRKPIDRSDVLIKVGKNSQYTYEVEYSVFLRGAVLGINAFAVTTLHIGTLKRAGEYWEYYITESLNIRDEIR